MADPAYEHDRMDRPGERRGFSAREQLRLLIPLVVVWAVGIAGLSLVSTTDDVGLLLLDPTWIGRSAWYAGIVSQLGAVAWCVAATSAAWSSWIAAAGGRKAASRLLRRGAFATAVLLVDDLFGFHSGLGPSLGIPKPLGQALIVAPVGFWLLNHLNDIRRTRWQVLCASLLAQAVSVGVDAFVHPGRFDRAVLWEDGPKFLGILAWATWFTLTARDIARSVVRSDLNVRTAEVSQVAPSPTRVGEARVGEARVGQRRVGEAFVEVTAAVAEEVPAGRSS